MVQFCAGVIAPGAQAGARRRQIPARVETATRDQQSAWAPVVACQQLQPLAPGCHQDATLNILAALMTVSILSKLTGLGQTGAGGESAARAVEGEAQGRGLASAFRPQLMRGGRVVGQRVRERTVS